MKEAINAAHAEIKTTLRAKLTKTLTRQELADFLEKLKDAVLCGDEKDRGKIVINEDMSALLGNVFGGNQKALVVYGDILNQCYDK